MSDLTHLSLFTGIGGIDLAAEWAGFRTVAQVEQDAFCQQVLAKHWPGVPRFDDVRAVTTDTLRDAGIERPTLVSGGFPCQPFSVAGERRGAEDDRFLWPEMLRIVQELRPAWVVGENVAGIISMALDDCIADLERIGYTCRAFAVPAAGVGAPHQRERVFIVANASSEPGGETSATPLSVGENDGSWGHAQRRGVRLSSPGTGEDVANADRLSKDYGRHGAGAIRGIRSSPSGVLGCEPHVANATSELVDRGMRAWGGRPGSSDRGGDVPDSDTVRCDLRRSEGEGIQWGVPAHHETDSGGADAPYTVRSGRQELDPASISERQRFGAWCADPRGSQWAVEPSICRVVDGVPGRVDRLRALGNAVVPQQVYPILRGIAMIEEARS